MALTITGGVLLGYVILFMFTLFKVKTRRKGLISASFFLGIGPVA